MNKRVKETTGSTHSLRPFANLCNTPYLGAKSITVEKISPAITAIIPEVEVSAKPNQAGTIKALK